MRREVSASIFAVLIVAAAILTVYYLNVGPTGFAIFSQNDNGAFFGAGNYTSYENVTWSGSAVVLNSSANATSGTYTSKVFDAGSSATWNNLTSEGSGVTFEVRSCSAADCANVSFSSANLGNLNLTGQYFQYRASLDSANDTLGSVAVDYTIAQQGTPLSVSVSEPSGEKNSLTAIPLTFTIAGGAGTNLTCSYDINYAGGVLVPNTVISCANGSNTQTFTLTEKGGDNTLTVYASDSSGNASASSGFSVSVPSGGITGGAVEEEEEQETPAPVAAAPAISLVAEVPSQTINQGNSRGLSLLVQNTGTAFATSCVLTGDDSG
ncbi:MAG: hypothetical protein Q8P79_00635, partial [Nanoarchaeota archaeon]|nr:hypothetical protein [Nanoarchaeota archaeon]